jgi:flagellar biosynthesis GTPase FlhF
MIVIAQPAFAASVAASQAPAESTAPTPIEQALIDHDCGVQRIAAASDSVYEACAAARLTSLRADFGRDLKGLSAAERRTVDTLCSKVRIAEGRDAYVSCVGEQLAALHARRMHAQPAAAETAAATPVVAPATDHPQPRTRWSMVLWIGGGLLLIGGVAAVVVMTRRRPAVRCRGCAAVLQEAGELCPSCRREAAEAARRATIERAAEAQTRDDNARRLREIEEAQRREQARRLNEERAQHEERLRREAQARDEAEEARRREDEARRRRESEAASAALDPYAILGVASDAGADAIEAAYQSAKAKYAPEQVEYLGDEAQAFYREKAAAVERAYQTVSSTCSKS